MRKEKDISTIAVVYARYSSRGQTEQSIEGQLSAARKYAKEKGYTIIHEYCDRAKTRTKSCQKQIVSVFVNAIYFTDESVEIAFNYTDDTNNKKWTRSKNTFEVRTCPIEQEKPEHIRTYVDKDVFVVEVHS